MRLAGASFAARAGRPDGESFRRSDPAGDGAVARARDCRRRKPTASASGFSPASAGSWSTSTRTSTRASTTDGALAGRTLAEEDRRLTLFAVGDGRPEHLRLQRRFGGVHSPFRGRLRAAARLPRPQLPLHRPHRDGRERADPAGPRPDEGRTSHPASTGKRAQDPPGGTWERLDPVARGRVQVLSAQPGATLAGAGSRWGELLRLASLAPEDWDWSACAVIAREWKYLEPVRAFCEREGIPVQMANEGIPSFWLLRETRGLVEWLRGLPISFVDGASLRDWVDAQPSGPWSELLREAVDEHTVRDRRRRGPGGPGHRVAGRVGPGRPAAPAWPDALDRAPRQGARVRSRGSARWRLGAPLARRKIRTHPAGSTTVAMTRARRTLALARFGDPRGGSRPDFVREAEAPAYAGRSHPLPHALPENGAVLYRSDFVLPPATPELARPLPAARSGRNQPGLRGSLPRPASGASRHRRPVPRRPPGGASGRAGTVGAARRRGNGGGAPRRRFRASGRRPVQVRYRPRDRHLESRSVEARLRGRSRVATPGRWWYRSSYSTEDNRRRSGQRCAFRRGCWPLVGESATRSMNGRFSAFGLPRRVLPRGDGGKPSTYGAPVWSSAALSDAGWRAFVVTGRFRDDTSEKARRSRVGAGLPR